MQLAGAQVTFAEGVQRWLIRRLELEGKMAFLEWKMKPGHCHSHEGESRMIRRRPFRAVSIYETRGENASR